MKFHEERSISLFRLLQSVLCQKKAGNQVGRLITYFWLSRMSEPSWDHGQFHSWSGEKGLDSTEQGISPCWNTVLILVLLIICSCAQTNIRLSFISVFYNVNFLIDNSPEVTSEFYLLLLDCILFFNHNHQFFFLFVCF